MVKQEQEDNLASSHAGYDSEAARDVIRIEDGDEVDKLAGIHFVADLHPDWVVDAPHELQMSTVQLARALPTP